MAESTEAWIGLAIQLPLVAAFIWFALKLIEIFTRSIDERDKSWRQFMEEQRLSNNAAISAMANRFADEIRTLGKEIAEMRGDLRK